jgi:putative NADPH-quinone reductase
MLTILRAEQQLSQAENNITLAFPQNNTSFPVLIKATVGYDDIS